MSAMAEPLDLTPEEEAHLRAWVADAVPGAPPADRRIGRLLAALDAARAERDEALGALRDLKAVPRG